MARTIRAVAWRPPPRPPRAGAYAPNERLAGAERWPLPPGCIGAEDVAFDAEGSAYTGVEDGRIVRYPPGGGDAEVVAATAGRPLGVEADHDGTLVVCDPFNGLLRVNPKDGSVVTLVDEHKGRRFVHVNNAAIASDGTVYFSESTSRWTLDDWMAAIYENQTNGTLYRCDPATGDVDEVARGLAYANGVALAPDGSYVLVAETARYRVRRVWLTGPSAGMQEVFVDNLPGFPDNISSTDDGRFWVALASSRTGLIDGMWPRPRLRQLGFRLPDALRPKETRFAMVVCLDRDGRVTDALEDPDAGYSFITGAREHDGWLYLGSLREDAIARVRL